MASPRVRPFAQVDVFSSSPFLGNPVAVILDGEGLSDEQMAACARWTNLSETTFFQAPSDPSRADYKLRIWTPGRELPFAGHPTLGSCAAWLAAGNTPRDPDFVVQECGLGLITIRLGAVDDRSSSGAGARRRLAFAAPENLRSGPPDAETLDQCLKALRLTKADVVASQWCDNGPGWLGILLCSAEHVLAVDLAKVDFSGFPGLNIGLVGAYPDQSANDTNAPQFELRAIVPKLALEDPVTGSLNAAVAKWLYASGIVSGKGYIASQGSKLGRKGRIHVERDETGDKLWIGGDTTICIQGSVVI